MAVEAGRRADAERVVRFGATERNLHTIHGVAFVVMFATGLVLWMPMLAQLFSDRPLTKAIHLTAAAAWLTALALIAILGDRRALRRTRRELERFDDDDRRWLRRVPSAPGRFNAGQKAHAVVQAALAVLFTVSGTLLLLGERNTALRLPGTIALHDMAMLVAGVLVAGHVWIALSPDKQPSVEGIVRGTVPRAWAAEHHPRWRPDADAPQPAPRPGIARLAAAAAVVALGAFVLATFVFT
ncbi:MAG: formate dehydrogenase subunit gamma [Solirubrobacteraceae bacterium]|nr:formate dehydrogenase subunit gamma [Solirubrobacteraceae bacterium]